ncbi:hypothetical protein ACP70R_033402 [Stipagrostis hirtigluma subsp. patula]
MGLRDIELTLPPGFRFYPSDDELVCYYLHGKVANDERLAGAGGAMVEVDLHTHEPWELPDAAKLSADEWYFFNFRDRKYATGLRANRATKSGYWKATGKDRVIHSPKAAGGRAAVVGMRKTLVFYHGRAPYGVKTSWVMHEFRMENPHTPPKEDWVLCRVFYKKKAMENEQEIAMSRAAAAYASSSPYPGYSPPFPGLGSSHYQLPSSSSDHHGGVLGSLNDFSAMALLQHNSILDSHGHQTLDGGSFLGAAGAPAAEVGGDQCGGAGVLMDLGLEEHYNYNNSLMR